MYLSKEALEEQPQDTKFFPAKSMALPVTDIILTSERGPEAEEGSGSRNSRERGGKRGEIDVMQRGSSEVQPLEGEEEKKNEKEKKGV